MPDNNGGLLSKTVEKLEITIHDLLRYVFTGFVALLALAMSHKLTASAVVESLGTALTGVATLTLGAGIYVVSRNTIVVGLMSLFERANTKLKAPFRTIYQFFREIDARFRFLESEEAFHVVREYRDEEQQPLIRPELTGQFHRQHSEIHMLYATALISFVSSAVLILIKHQWCEGLTWFFTGASFSAVAVLADCRLSIREACQLRRIGKERVTKILNQVGSLPLSR